MEQARVQELLERLEVADVRAFQVAHNQINPRRPLLVTGDLDPRSAEALELHGKAPAAFRLAVRTARGRVR